MAVPNLTPQEQAIRAQILQRWGGSGAWDNDSVDLAGDLARRMVASGIADLDKLQFTPTTRREMVRAEYYDNDAEYHPAQFADYDNAFDLTYDGKVVGSKGFIGNINRDGSLGDGDVFSSNTYHPNLLAWSSRGKGAREYRVEFDAQGNPVVNPVFQSSSFWNSDLGGLVKAAATAVAMYSGLGALGAAAGSGAGAAGAGAAAGGAAGSGAAGMTAAEQVAMMAANGMADAQIAAALGTQGAQAAGLAGVGGGAAAAGTTAAGAAAPAAGGAGAATGLAGAAKTALPWVSAATQLYGTYAQGKAAEDAAAAQQAAAQQGIGEQRRQFDLVQSLLAPYAQAGTKAIGAQADLAGLNGPDAQRAAITALESSPQMAALTKQGETAILQNASATGGLRGGNVQGALATFRPQMLSALIEQQYGRLGGLTSIGQNAAAGTGNAGMATGNNVTQLLGQIGASQAGGALAQGATNAGYAAAIAQLAGMFSGLGQQGPGGTPPIAPTTRGGF